MRIFSDIAEFVKKTPQTHEQVVRETSATQKKGKEALIKARMKLHRQRLKGEIAQPNGMKKEDWDYKFTDTEKSGLEKAFNIKIAKNATNESIKKTVSGFSAENLIKANKKNAGTLMLLFAHSIDRQEKIDVYKKMGLGSKFETGQPVEINLNLCPDAYRRIGLKALTSNQPGITRLYVKNLEKGKGKSGYAVRGADGHFYWEDTKTYAAIYWAIITPMEILSKADLKKKGLPTQADWDNMTSSSRRGFSKKTATERRTTAPTRPGKKLALDNTPSKKDLTRFPQGVESADKPMTRAEFQKQCELIKQVTSIDRLISMRKEVRFHPRDPLVEIPGTGKKLRAPVALCHVLYRRYLELLSAKTGNRYELGISSGYRDADLQAKLWNTGYRKRLAQIQQNHPTWPHERLHAAASAENSEWVAPRGSSPHNTGGAQDIYINENGKRLTSFKFKLKGRWTRYDKRIFYIRQHTVYEVALLDTDKQRPKLDEMEKYQLTFLSNLVKQTAEKNLSIRDISNKMNRAKMSLWLRATDIRYIASLNADQREEKLKEYLRTMKSFYVVALDNLSQNDLKAVRLRKYLDEKLLTSFFLGKTYYREGWHHNLYRDNNGRRIYANV